jgi:hypothetical protein
LRYSLFCPARQIHRPRNPPFCPARADSSPAESAAPSSARSVSADAANCVVAFRNASPARPAARKSLPMSNRSKYPSNPKRQSIVSLRQSRSLHRVCPRAGVLSGLPPISSLSFPRHHFGVSEAPKCVWILAPDTPGTGDCLQFGTGGNAIFQRFLGNVGVQRAVGIGIGPFPRCGRVGVGHGRCCNASFSKSRLAEPMSKMASGVRLPAVTTREFIIESQEAANSLVLRIKRRASPINITNADDPAERQ